MPAMLATTAAPRGMCTWLRSGGWVLYPPAMVVATLLIGLMLLTDTGAMLLMEMDVGRVAMVAGVVGLLTTLVPW